MFFFYFDFVYIFSLSLYIYVDNPGQKHKRLHVCHFFFGGEGGGALAFFGGPGRQQRSKNKANTTKQIGEHPICFLFAFFKHHF
jgi:hypothetical protein